MYLNYKSIGIGFVVSAVFVLVLGDLGYIFGGLVVGYLITNDYYDGAINGAIASGLVGLLVALYIAFILSRIIGAYNGFYGSSGTSAIMYGTLIFAAIQAIVIGLVLGGIGGAAGVFVYEQLENRNMQKSGVTSRLDGNGYLVCVKCNTYYKLESGESPGDFTNECECGGKFKFFKNIDWLNN